VIGRFFIAKGKSFGYNIPRSLPNLERVLEIRTGEEEMAM